MNWNILGFRILGSTAASLSLVNLLRDFNAINIYGSLALWAYAYNYFVNYVFDNLLFWIKLPFFNISGTERHLIVVDSILIGAIFRNIMIDNILRVRKSRIIHHPETSRVLRGADFRDRSENRYIYHIKRYILYMLVIIIFITAIHGFIPDNLWYLTSIIAFIITFNGFLSVGFNFLRSLLEIFAVFLCVIALNYLLFL